MGAIGLWLLKNWKLVAVGIAMALLVAYITTLRLEVSHYKAKADDIQAKFTLYKNDAEAKQAKLEAGAKAISDRHEHALAEADAQRDRANKATQEKIATNEELKRTRISLDAVRLLNESTLVAEELAPTIETNAGSPTRTEADSVSLALVFGVVAENNKNHLACTARLNEWITFWGEYTAVVKDAQDARP
jgi:hypothetical protein